MCVCVSMQWCNQCIHIEFQANWCDGSGGDGGIKTAADKNSNTLKQLHSGGNTFGGAGVIVCCQCRLWPQPTPVRSLHDFACSILWTNKSEKYVLH